MNRLKEYADRVVNLIEELKDIEDECEDRFLLSLQFDSGILVHKDIEKLASAVGEVLFVEEIDDDMGIFNARTYFDYRGFRFVQYRRKDEV